MLVRTIDIIFYPKVFQTARKEESTGPRLDGKHIPYKGIQRWDYGGTYMYFIRERE